MTTRQNRKARRAAERLEQKPSPVTKAEINRSNAAHSTGPRTPEGKARSSRNSLQHGLYSNALLLPWEDPAELEQLRAALHAEHRPATPTEEILVAELSENFWRIRRFRYLEAQFLGAEHFDASLVSALQRSLAAAERGFHKSLATLRQLQKERSGFVPQNLESEPDEPAILSEAKTQQDAAAEFTEPKTQRAFVPQNSPPEHAIQPQAVPNTPPPDVPLTLSSSLCHHL